MATENLNLAEIGSSTKACDGLIEAFNGNMRRLDGLALPIQSGGNSQLSFFKLADGTAVMWGRIETGQRYVCSTEFEGHAFASEAFTVTWPVAIAGTSPTVIATVETDRNPDIFALSSNITTSQGTFCFLANFDEGTGAYGPVNNKTLHLLVIGRWR